MQSNVELRAPRPSAALERRRKWEQLHRRRLTLSDSIIVSVSALVGVAAQWAQSGRLLEPAEQAVALVVPWILLLGFMHTRSSEVLGLGITEYQRTAHASGLALGILATLGIIFQWEGTRFFLFVVGPPAMVGLLLSRWFWRRWLHRQRLAGHYVSRTLVVGFESDVRYVIHSLATSGENGFHVVAATLFDGPKSSWIPVGENHIPVYGDVDSVAATAAKIEADRIVVASSPVDRPEFVKQLSWKLEGMAAELVLSQRVSDVVGPRISFRPIDGLPMLQISIPSYEGGKHLFKRVLDVVVASIALVPVMLLVPILGLIIKLNSPGPVFYRQERLGRDGRKFLMLKFRTMRVGADSELAMLQGANEGAGPLFKMREDPRVTGVGKVLRRLSLDELPQFWNVLVGDMSVVGPRPPLPTEAEQYGIVATRRMYIKPGITGLWQVSGRSDLSWDESVRLDLHYVENWSLIQDIQIMWRTAKVMFHPTGAY